MTLQHGPAHLYRATIEATAFGVRWIVDLLREHGVPVRRFIATGGLPRHNPLIVKIYADVLQETIEVHPSEQGPAKGAAILGAMAAGQATGLSSATEILTSMSGTGSDRLERVAPDADCSAAEQPR